jgi:hypothetical protein
MKERGEDNHEDQTEGSKGDVVGISLPMAAWMFRFLCKLMETLFYMIGTVVGSAYL